MGRSQTLVGGRVLGWVGALDFTHTRTHSHAHTRAHTCTYTPPARTHTLRGEMTLGWPGRRLLRAHLPVLRISGEGASLPPSTHTGNQDRTPTVPPPRATHAKASHWPGHRADWPRLGTAPEAQWQEGPPGAGAGGALRKEEHGNPERGSLGATKTKKADAHCTWKSKIVFKTMCPPPAPKFLPKSGNLLSQMLSPERVPDR